MATTKKRKKYIRKLTQEEGVRRASEIIDRMVEEFDEHSRKEHRRFIQRELAGKEANEEEKEKMTTECPQCGKKVEGEDEIEELFGWRYDGEMPQSWCKDCRNS